MNHTDVFSVWHYLHGFFIKNQGVGKYLVQSGDRLGIFTNICTNREKCQDVGNLIEGFDEETFERLIDLLDQPKIHSKNDDDFSLVPLCSFGNDTLKKCHLFQKSKLIYQDNTCFTYDQPKQSQVGRNNGLNLILNLKSIPKDEPSTLKLFVHQPGSIPDVLNLVSGLEEIRENSWTNIGISINSYETTENFNGMSFRKRKCTLDHSNRTECLVNLVHNYAIKTCNCSPFPSSNGQSVCDLDGSYCFRNAIKTANINENECPVECTLKEYQTTKSTDSWDNPFSFGQDFVDFLLDNPAGLILKNETHGNEYGQRGYEGLIRTIWNDFSLVQIYFDQPLID